MYVPVLIAAAAALAVLAVGLLLLRRARRSRPGHPPVNYAQQMTPRGGLRIPNGYVPRPDAVRHNGTQVPAPRVPAPSELGRGRHSMLDTAELTGLATAVGVMRPLSSDVLATLDAARRPALDSPTTTVHAVRPGRRHVATGSEVAGLLAGGAR